MTIFEKLLRIKFCNGISRKYYPRRSPCRSAEIIHSSDFNLNLFHLKFKKKIIDFKDQRTPKLISPCIFCSNFNQKIVREHKFN